MRHSNEPYYEVAQVCLNGHVITKIYNISLERRKSFCDKCGAPTIHQCQNCGENIQGEYMVPGMAAGGFTKKAPVYCFNCGEPFPWTESRLEAARELVAGTDDFDGKDELVESLPDLVSDNPRTIVAATKWKKALIQVGGFTVDAFREIIIDVLSESAKKILFP